MSFFWRKYKEQHVLIVHAAQDSSEIHEWNSINGLNIYKFRKAYNKAPKSGCKKMKMKI